MLDHSVCSLYGLSSSAYGCPNSPEKFIKNQREIPARILGTSDQRRGGDAFFMACKTMAVSNAWTNLCDELQHAIANSSVVALCTSMVAIELAYGKMAFVHHLWVVASVNFFWITGTLTLTLTSVLIDQCSGSISHMSLQENLYIIGSPSS